MGRRLSPHIWTYASSPRAVLCTIPDRLSEFQTILCVQCAPRPSSCPWLDNLFSFFFEKYSHYLSQPRHSQLGCKSDMLCKGFSQAYTHIYIYKALRLA